MCYLLTCEEVSGDIRMKKIEGSANVTSPKVLLFPIL